MNLTPRELDKLHIFMTAELARKRKARGLKLMDILKISLYPEKKPII